MDWLRLNFKGHAIIWHNGCPSLLLGFKASHPVAVAILSNSQVNMDWYSADLIEWLSSPTEEARK